MTDSVEAAPRTDKTPLAKACQAGMTDGKKSFTFFPSSPARQVLSIAWIVSVPCPGSRSIKCAN